MVVHLPKYPTQFPSVNCQALILYMPFMLFIDTWLLSFFSSSTGWFFTSASTVPTPKYSQPSFSSLKFYLFILFLFFLSISQLESWNLKALHKYLSVKDIRSDFQFAHFSWGGRQCWLGIYLFFLKQFVAKLENRWEMVWPFQFPGFLVESRFYRFFRFFSYFWFFMITKPVCIPVHGRTGEPAGPVRFLKLW